MIVLALLLLVLVAAVVAFVLVEGVDQTVQLSADWIGFNWRPSIIVVFLLGALCLFAAELALALMRGGFRRGRNRRRELKRLREAERQRAAMHAGNEHYDASEQPGGSEQPGASEQLGATGHTGDTGHPGDTGHLGETEQPGTTEYADGTWHGTTQSTAVHPRPGRHEDTWRHGDALPTVHQERPESPSDPDAPPAHRGSWYDDPPRR